MSAKSKFYWTLAEHSFNETAIVAYSRPFSKDIMRVYRNEAFMVSTDMDCFIQMSVTKKEGSLLWIPLCRCVRNVYTTWRMI